MAGRKKRGEVGNTNMRISRESKVFFRWNKKHFSLLFNGYPGNNPEEISVW